MTRAPSWPLSLLLTVSVGAGACGGLGFRGGYYPTDAAPAEAGPDATESRPDVVEEEAAAPPIDVQEDVQPEPGPEPTPDVQPPPDTGPGPCSSDRDCSGYGLVCDEPRSLCVECTSPTDCSGTQTCNADHRCVARVCTPNVSECLDGATRRVCDAYGTAWTNVACGTNRACRSGTCVDLVCTPMAADCPTSTTRRVCNSDGLGYTNTTCPSAAHASPLCSGGTCSTTCNSGFNDCDRDASNGCESPVNCDIPAPTAIVADFPFNGALTELISGRAATGSNTWVADRLSNPNRACGFTAASFHRITQTITGLPQGNAPRTLALWIRDTLTPTADAYRSLATWGAISAFQRFGLSIRVASGVETIFMTAEGADVSCPAVVLDTLYHHVAVTYDGTVARVYFDGTMCGSGAIALSTAGTTLTLGAKPGAAEYFDGRMDDVLIYGRALSGAEIAQLRTAAPQ